MKKGVYTATKKDGTLYYRSSITFQNKHISLGSFSSEDLAATAYLEAEKLLRTHVLTLDRFEENCTLLFCQMGVPAEFSRQWDVYKNSDLSERQLFLLLFFAK